MAVVGAVVLVGGRSSRMGRPKAALPWHGSTLLRRVTGLAARTVDGPVVVVRAPGQELPDVAPGVEVVDDEQEGRGPLQGIASGLAALDGRADGAFVCAVDLPFLHPAFVRRVTASLDGADVAVPVVRGYRQPTAAAYRTGLAGRAATLLSQGRDRAAFLLEDATVVTLDDAALLADPRVAAADPGLRSVDGVNDPQAYAQAHAEPQPEVVVRGLGVLASEPVTVRAATLGGAAAAFGRPLDRHVLAAVDGVAVGRDPQAPLAAGELVTFLSADAGG